MLYRKYIALVVMLSISVVFIPMENVMAQPPYLSPLCPTGGEEAEKLFQLGVDYHLARKGMPYDPERAEKLYDEALKKGNAKAALNLAILYRKDFGQWPKRWERLQYGVALLEAAASMNCPDALFALAQHYSMGWGVEVDARKARRLVKKAAKEGSPAAIIQYAERLNDDGKEKKAMAMLEKSLEMGNGNASFMLGIKYLTKNDAKNLIRVARKGSSLGSIKALHFLIYIYNNYGQKKDVEYLEKIKAIIDSIDRNEAPKPIKDFDRLLPPKPLELPSKN